MSKKIIFMGTAQIAADILEALTKQDVDIVLAVSQPDRLVGRKQKLEPTPVKTVAEARGIPVFQPEKIKTDYEPIEKADADLIVTCAYGQIVPVAVLEAAKMGAVNLHASLLPKYRGAAPIQRAIWNGETVSGMALMKMEAGMDTGGVYDIEQVAIEPDETSTSLFDKMAKAGIRLMEKDLDALLEGTLECVEQDHDQATYAAMIHADEEIIDFSKPDSAICHQIQALADEPGAYVLADGKKLKILKGRYEMPALGEIGTINKETKKIVSLNLHDGRLILETLKPEGKNEMSGSAWLNGAGQKLIGKQVQGRGLNGSEA